MQRGRTVLYFVSEGRPPGGHEDADQNDDVDDDDGQSTARRRRAERERVCVRFNSVKVELVDAVRESREF